MDRNSNTTYLEDGEISELYWRRDESAIHETDRKYKNYLYTIAYNILHDKIGCDDCLRDTYFAVWNRIPPARPTLFHAFLGKITRNISVGRFRKEHAKKNIPSEYVVSIDELANTLFSSDDPEVAAEVGELIDLINRYLHSLCERDAFIFVCRYYYCDTARYIADMLDLSRRTVERALKKMREDLALLLREEGVGYEG